MQHLHEKTWHLSNIQHVAYGPWTRPNKGFVLQQKEIEPWLILVGSANKGIITEKKNMFVEKSYIQVDSIWKKEHIQIKI